MLINDSSCTDITLILLHFEFNNKFHTLLHFLLHITYSYYEKKITIYKIEIQGKKYSKVRYGTSFIIYVFLFKKVFSLSLSRGIRFIYVCVCLKIIMQPTAGNSQKAYLLTLKWKSVMLLDFIHVHYICMWIYYKTKHKHTTDVVYLQLSRYLWRDVYMDFA